MAPSNANQLVTCSRCGREPSGDIDGWNAVFKDGYLTGHLCPEHQTPKESTEAEFNAIVNEGTTFFRPEPGSPEAAAAVGEFIHRNAINVLEEWVAAYNAGNSHSFDPEELAIKLRARLEKRLGPSRGDNSTYIAMFEDMHDQLVRPGPDQQDEESS